MVGALGQERFERRARAVEFARLEGRAGDGEPALRRARRQLRQGLGPLQPVERQIAGAQIDIDLREIRMRLTPPCRLDDLGRPAQIAPARQKPPGQRRRRHEIRARASRHPARRQRAVRVTLGAVQRVGGQKNGAVASWPWPCR